MAQPSQAQMDFAGEWAPVQDEDNTGNPYVGEFLGIPMSRAGSLRAQAWNASLYTLPEWQCRPHPADYGTRGPANLRIWKEVDPITQRVVAYHTHVQWQGFSTGKWEGNSLVVTTTHLKESYLRRNGVPRSDQATLVEYWSRHGNFLTLASMVQDPVYLTEPVIRTTNWAFAPQQNIEPYPCEVGEEIDRAEGVIPHHLPGTNPYLADFAKKENLPEVAARGGAATMFPEFMAVLKSKAPFTAPVPVFPTSAVVTPRAEPGLRVQKIQGNVYMLLGDGGNIAVQTGKQGALVVDTGSGKLSDKVIAAMAGQTFKAPSGITSTMDAKNHHLHKAVFIGEVQADGQFKVVWKTKGPVKAQPWSPYIPGNEKKKDEPALMAEKK